MRSMTMTLPKHECDDWIQQIPKVELHVHLEGAIPLDALWELICKYGGDFQARTRKSLDRRFRFKDFPHFIDTWVWKNRFLREYDDFTFIAQHVARNLANQNIRYAELFYSPPDFARMGLTTQKLTEAIWTGLKSVENIETRLVADLVRDFGPKQAAITLQDVNDVKDFGVIGIGIGGSEQKFPPEPFAEVFETARSMGFRTSAHAGEAAGPDSIWGAIQALRVDRIGHGTRAIEDPALMDYLAEHRIPVEMCPISNVRTGIVESIRMHPVRMFVTKGVCVTINTDDPAMFGNSLLDEYRTLITHHAFTKKQIIELHHNAIHSGWMSEQQRVGLLKALHTSTNDMESPHQ